LTTQGDGSAILPTSSHLSLRRSRAFGSEKFLPRQSEQTSESHTLPPPELNPLINPLLAENMGRWAEVYFTSPPESREQAVLDLLRELEAEKSRRDAALASELAAQPPLVSCQNCGYENPANNKFCGMCGAASDSSRANGSHFLSTPQSHRNADQLASEVTERSSEESYEEFAAPRHELSLFQAYRETDSDDPGVGWDYEPARSSSYRGYIGLVLAMLLLGLGYMAWRQMQNSQASRGISAPPPVAAQPLPADTRAASPSKPESPDVAAENKAAPVADPAGKSNKPAESTPVESSDAGAASPHASAKAPATAPKSSERSRATEKAAPDASTADVPPTTDKWGAEELAVAERYLNGANGQRRDTAEAAKWLWKSIAKHNGQATLLLADLYLKGNGVSKNCDQARVLLYSAARKGVHGAGERLRNLPAFGCQ
jgi:TPR repeat protein